MKEKGASAACRKSVYAVEWCSPGYARSESYPWSDFMTDIDDHVIPYEEAVRRHRLIEEQKRKGVIREVKISDAMSHLLEEEASEEDEGPTPAHLRHIVEREFSVKEDSGRLYCRLDERPVSAGELPPAPHERSEEPPRH